LNQVELAYKKHKRWLEIVSTFGGLSEDECKDLVQTMYVLLIKNSQKGVDFTYGDDINYYYVFKLLRGLYVDLIRKKSKVKKFSLDTIKDLPDETKIDIENKYQLIQKELNKQHWYDKKVFEIIESGVSIAELERKSKIGYFSLRNTYNKVKQKLISLL
tara:strand:- start:706 stop:1182 length:477 start_codon:yes stop_codon:yes gene_type:complete